METNEVRNVLFLETDDDWKKWVNLALDREFRVYVRLIADFAQVNQRPVETFRKYVVILGDLNPEQKARATLWARGRHEAGLLTFVLSAHSRADQIPEPIFFSKEDGLDIFIAKMREVLPPVLIEE